MRAFKKRVRTVVGKISEYNFPCERLISLFNDADGAVVVGHNPNFIKFESDKFLIEAISKDYLWRLNLDNFVGNSLLIIPVEQVQIDILEYLENIKFKPYIIIHNGYFLPYTDLKEIYNFENVSLDTKYISTLIHPSKQLLHILFMPILNILTFIQTNHKNG